MEMLYYVDIELQNADFHTVSINAYSVCVHNAFDAVIVRGKSENKIPDVQHCVIITLLQVAPLINALKVESNLFWIQGYTILTAATKLTLAEFRRHFEFFAKAQKQ